jgi:hypothetical protein
MTHYGGRMQNTKKSKPRKTRNERKRGRFVGAASRRPVVDAALKRKASRRTTLYV